MCDYFSCYATRKTKEILFCEKDEHSVISDRANLGELTTDDVVKIECTPQDDGTWNFRIDENTRPEWVEKWTGLRQKVIRLAKKVDVYHKEYQPKRDAIYKEHQTKREAIYKEYIENLKTIKGYVAK
jgi:hypothetical protein